MADILQKIASNLYNGENEVVAELVQEALDQGMAPEELLAGGLIAGMDEVGKDFKAGDLFVPEVLIAARAMHAGMGVLRPLLAESDVPSAGKYVIGTVGRPARHRQESGQDDAGRRWLRDDRSGGGRKARCLRGRRARTSAQNLGDERPADDDDGPDENDY